MKKQNTSIPWLYNVLTFQTETITELTSMDLLSSMGNQA